MEAHKTVLEQWGEVGEHSKEPSLRTANCEEDCVLTLTHFGPKAETKITPATHNPVLKPVLWLSFPAFVLPDGRPARAAVTS